MAEVTREEVNGLGGRVRDVELDNATMKGKVKRNSDDIQDIFVIAADTQKSVDRGKWQVLVMVSIPVIILIIQSLLK